MRFFVMGDVHFDFWIYNWNKNAPTKDYEYTAELCERFYELMMLPADAIIIPGDVANDFYTHVNFIRWCASKYPKVYFVMGNHDLGVRGHTFGNGNPDHTSEERIRHTAEALSDLENVHLLDGNIVDNIGGCMGMCDFTMRYVDDYDMSVHRWRKSMFDAKAWAYMNDNATRSLNPCKIWDAQKETMISLASQGPKIMVTHYAPSELGIFREYTTSEYNAFFYFRGKQFLELMPDDSYWLCGHIHNMGKRDYVKEDGGVVHIWAMPAAYPYENPYDGIGGMYTREDRILEL